MRRIEEVEMATSFEDLGGQPFPNYETLDTMIATSLKKIIQNSNFRKKVHPEEQKAQKDDRFLRMVGVVKNDQTT